ncbi:uncharacterized protein METZ01_LOCUS446425 [marine metagenome]|uniref:HMA domain-containing protein n=1 Tax=marine metagenome TaxID=408172 RepID=A0A382ZDJ8_9ZZZZ
MKHYRNLLIGMLACMVTLFAGAVPASETKSGSKEPPALKPDEVRLRVKGLVCAFCAQGLRKKVSKLDFVDTKKPRKGVTVDEKNGYMVVVLKSGKTPVWKDLFVAVEKAGFEATEGEALVDGERVVHKPDEKK